MPIKDIIEVENKSISRDQKPIKEKKDINVQLIIAKNIPKRNGSIYVLCGSGGSGKASLILNIFKTKQLYINKFIIYFIFVLQFQFYQLINNHLKIKKCLFRINILCFRRYL